MFNSHTTIAAIATPAGQGGVGIIRLSGTHALSIAKTFLKREPQPRHAYFCEFYTHDQQLIDQGLLLFFPAPHSFTGETVVELQIHGSMILLQRLLQRCLELGATLARAGEFSERAFLNGKLDLIQAEAIHDVIVSQSDAQASAALASLQGVFSKRVYDLREQLIYLRTFIEAMIDFSDEDIDPLSNHTVSQRLMTAQTTLEQLLNEAGQGKILRDGLDIVLAGRPNAGKSSVLNALSGTDTAIVTPIAGTTRDVLQTAILINGVPINLIDTAGIRETDDPIEQEGVRRAKAALNNARLILWLHAIDDHESYDEHLNALPTHIPRLEVINKVDLSEKQAGKIGNQLFISAKTGAGLDHLKTEILHQAGFIATESVFSARTRHIKALENTQTALLAAQNYFTAGHTLELMAEELRLALQHLNEMTGEFTTDDLLGEIFSTFCIGK